MAPFNQQTVSVVSRTRCSELHFTNPATSAPFVVLVYEIEQQVGDAAPTYLPDPRHVRVEFQEDGSFPQVNPSTNEPTGTSYTHADVYRMLYSLAANALKERDGN